MREHTPESRAFYEKRYNKPHALDLGDDHYADWFCWAPDHELNPQYDGIPDVERAGATIYHRRANGDPCAGAVTFAQPGDHPLNTATTWDVISLDPLHIEPSVLCGCGDHGFIRDGRWVRA
jgi:hypothetical protein